MFGTIGRITVPTVINSGQTFLLAIVPQAMFPAVEWIKAAIWGIPFTHYMLDSKSGAFAGIKSWLRR